ncbi:MAG: tetratricopeptide repeat protein [Candidatus Marinimicrobia bacterium]|nr:tetratricopeptide repeat protein [Candidatus Neomarinimicrobiota bacterium]
MKRVILSFVFFMGNLFAEQNIADLSARGEKFIQSKSWDEAKATFELILQTDSTNIFGYYGLATVYYYLGDLENSLGNWSRGRYFDPSNENLHNFRKEVIDGAVRSFKSVLEEDSTNTAALFSVGQIYFFLNNLDKSYEYVNHALKVDPGNEKIRSFQEKITIFGDMRSSGRKAYDAGDLNKSDEVFSKLVQKRPEYSLSYYYLGMSQFMRGNDEKGASFLNQAINLELDTSQKEQYRADLTNRAKQYFNEGKTEHKRGNLAVAKEKYLSALRLDPKFYQSNFQMGWIYLKEGDFRKSSEEFQRVIDVLPTYAKAYYGLALVQYKNGQYKNSLDNLKQSIALDENYEKAHYQMGVIQMESKNYGAAIKAFQNAVRINPDYERAHYLLGRICVAENRFDQAIQSLEKTVDINPKFYKAYSYLAQSYNKLGKCDDALDAATSCLKIKTTYAPALIEKGDALHCIGLGAEAIAAYEKARANSKWREIADYKIDMIKNADRYE